MIQGGGGGRYALGIKDPQKLKRPSTKLHSESGNDNDDDVNDDNDDNDYHDGCDDDMCQDVNMSRATFQRIAFRD